MVTLLTGDVTADLLRDVTYQMTSHLWKWMKNSEYLGNGRRSRESVNRQLKGSRGRAFEKEDLFPLGASP